MPAPAATKGRRPVPADLAQSTPLIRVRGGKAYLWQVTEDVRDAVLRVRDPNAEHTQSYKDGRWDGYAYLGSGSTFPAGLVPWVLAGLEAQGLTATVEGDDPRQPVADGQVTGGELEGVTLWPHQVGALNAMLAHTCGAIRLPTGSGKTIVAIVYSLISWALSAILAKARD
jgi:hypothetical protein